MAAEQKYDYDIREAWANLHRLWQLSRPRPELREKYWAACVTTEAQLKFAERTTSPKRPSRSPRKSHKAALLTITRNAEALSDEGA